MLEDTGNGGPSNVSQHREAAQQQPSADRDNSHDQSFTPKQQQPPSKNKSAKTKLSKDDPEAKKALIREIEGLRGRKFIKKWIPKCHHPVSKRSGSGKRSDKREYDPMCWGPAVLKAILSLAKSSPEKKWLAKALYEAVELRIQNTGDIKPQLVITDFVVIEDMLLDNWELEYAPHIRNRRK